MTTYVRTQECEAMQWVDPNPDDNPEEGATEHDAAIAIIKWINDNGGEARYLTACLAHRLVMCHYHGCPSPCPVIAIRTRKGWGYAQFGHYVVMGTVLFEVYDDRPAIRRCRDFHLCNSEMFEHQDWREKQ